VLRVPCTFRLTLASGRTLTCADAARRLLASVRRQEVRAAEWASIGGTQEHRLTRDGRAIKIVGVRR
jgi:hypothetical protein